MHVDHAVAVRVATDRALAVAGPVGQRSRPRRVQIPGRENDALAGVPEFVAALSLSDESVAQLREVIVEQTGVADTDPVAELRERERVVGRGQFPEDRQPMLVRDGREGFGRFPGRGLVRIATERVLDCHGRRVVAAFDVLCGT